MRWSIVIPQEAVLNATECCAGKRNEVVLQQLFIRPVNTFIHCAAKSPALFAIPYNASPHLNGDRMRVSTLHVFWQKILPGLSPNAHTSVTAEQTETGLVGKRLFSTAVVASVLSVSSTAPFQPRVQGRVAANSASSSNEEPSPESSS